MATNKTEIWLTAKQIDTAVRLFYSRAGMTVLSQVRNGTGYERRQTRTADMLAISTWPSRGLYATGIEIKVSKSDLIAEIANPKKADDIARFCRYWILAVPQGLTRGVQIPDKWGVIEVSEKLIGSQIVPCGVLTPVEMDSLFVCSVLRNFAECHVHVDEIGERVKTETAAAVERRRLDEEREVKRAQELLLAVERWEKDHGLKLTDYSGKNLGYDAKRIGQAVKLLIGLRANPIEQLSHAAAAVNAAAVALEGIFADKLEIL